jgi:gliding motility-associated-like protein
MKSKKFFLTFYFFLFAVISAYGADPYCQNIGFEHGNFDNWEGYTWVWRTDTVGLNVPKKKGIVVNRQTIMTDTNAYDPNTGRKLKIIPKGYSYSARLGANVNQGLMESLSYKLQVDKNNALLVWKFAVVLEDPKTTESKAIHAKFEEPRFKVTLFDENGDTIHNCANYDVYASDARIENFQTYYPFGGTANPIFWRDWTAVGADLSAYIGKTISIEFMAADCTRGAHYGYAYFVAECHPLNITVNYCESDVGATLTAPEGFNYSWVNASEAKVGTSQSLTIPNPKEGEEFTCKMTSETGCPVTLKAKTERYVPKADFSYELDCTNNSVKFTNLSYSPKGTLTYLWDFGDGTTSTDKHPSHIFVTSGKHKVSLQLGNPPSSCGDVMQKEIDSFSPDLVGVTGSRFYCANKKTTLKAYGAFKFEWFNGGVSISKADSLDVDTPEDIWLVAYSSSGCSTKIPLSVREEPQWKLTVDGPSAFCYGDSIQLTASGAASYKWSTGHTTNSIYVKKPGLYNVAGLSPIGCEQSVSVNIDEVALPESNFIILNPSVDARHSVLKCFVVGPKPNTEYNWEMGDGSFETGTTVQHRYSGVLNADLKYEVTLKATNSGGCYTKTSVPVEIVPFFPNVFTPNGDGINDLLMEGLEILVFDRNGVLLYSGNTGWDGKYKGKDMDSDTYFYTASYTDRNKQRKTEKGSVTLIR